MQAVKLIVIGPQQTGKTTISNFLADATDISYDYRPTKGVRILEFEVENVSVKNKSINVDVELWDCSGDKKYENCWPAMGKDAQGIIFVYNKKNDDNVRAMEKLYDYFVTKMKIQDKNCVIFYFDADKSPIYAPKQISNTFAKISQVNCNVEEGGNKLRADFQSFLTTLMTKIQEKFEQEENQILRG
ncbi:hypothetical protein HCN44_004584 [Aphidius gifuensis]|uniref:Uncharacterized protein n=1 Tax=Aphidius gifuensis TaxID=684658 RepID=A0A834XZC6_APHGI|nr:intraflagellar transport protein 22 homolog [Aphidius gifuensis]KAF7995112.1 hypothetical protein HCN44_004584 [Aphidius gifuensis]